MSRLRLPIVVCACCLFWAFVGALLGALARHALGGLILGLLFGIGYTLFGSWAAEKFPLEIWDATLLENSQAPNLYEMLHELCEKTGVELPTLYHCPQMEPNAFLAAGREGVAAMVVTTGLTRHLEKAEVQAVAALMMARLATDVMPVWTIAATLAGLPLHWGLCCRRKKNWEWLGTAILSVFAYPAAGLLRLAWSEGVVTAADYHAAHLAEWPGALHSALAKMEAARSLQDPDALYANPATALLFAVPPLVAGSVGEAGSGGVSFRQRALAAFLSRQPDAATRAARFLGEAAPAPVEPA